MAWVKITGNSYPVKEQLKAIGAKWNPKDKCWMIAKELAAEAMVIVGSVTFTAMPMLPDRTRAGRIEIATESDKRRAAQKQNRKEVRRVCRAAVPRPVVRGTGGSSSPPWEGPSQFEVVAVPVNKPATVNLTRRAGITKPEVIEAVAAADQVEGAPLAGRVKRVQSTESDTVS